MDIVKELERHQLMLAVRTQTPEQAFMAASACVEGGIRFIEITFSVPQADEVIKKLSADKRVVVGAGTVQNVGEARKALKAGASYIVSPNLDEAVVKFTRQEGAVSIPGACTPTEIYKAYKAGGDIIKLFPFVEIGGLEFLRVIRGPFPYIKYMLCGGLTLENLPDYLAAKAACILVGSAIIRRELVAAGDWQAIESLARAFVSRIKKCS